MHLSNTLFYKNQMRSLKWVINLYFQRKNREKLKKKISQYFKIIISFSKLKKKCILSVKIYYL